MATSFSPSGNFRDGAEPAHTTEYQTMWDQLQAIVADGLAHGYFDCSISSEIIGGHRRRVVIKSGKSYTFTIPEDDLPGDS